MLANTDARNRTYVRPTKITHAVDRTSRMPVRVFTIHLHLVWSWALCAIVTECSDKSRQECGAARRVEHPVCAIAEKSYAHERHTVSKKLSGITHEALNTMRLYGITATQAVIIEPFFFSSSSLRDEPGPIRRAHLVSRTSDGPTPGSRDSGTAFPCDSQPARMIR